MSTLRVLYLLLAVLGALPALWFWGLALSAGNLDWTTLAFPPMVSSFNLPLMGGGLVTLIAFTLWVCAETWVRRNWSAFCVFPALLLFGLGCAFPLYLFLRTRPV